MERDGLRKVAGRGVSLDVEGGRYGHDLLVRKQEIVKSSKRGPSLTVMEVERLSKCVHDRDYLAKKT